MNDIQRRLANLSPAQRALLEQKLTAVEKPLQQTPSIQRKGRRKQPTVLSFAQQRLWFLDQLLPGGSPYNIPIAFRLSGLLNIECLERSLNAVMRRHEVLRTTIESVEGKPFQIVGEGRPLELAIHDLSLRTEEEREAEASKFLTQEAQRPFNLARDLMLRATLIKLAGAEHILLVVVHHIASDGWSMGILMRELSHFYEAELSGRPSSLPDLPIQYADYTEWQRGWLQGEVLNEQLDYWKRQLAGVPTRLDLSTDRPRPAVQTFRGASRQIELSPELTQGLRTLSLREKASLFMTLLAAFQVLLFRYTGQDDIVLGSPIAGRNRGEVEGLVGFFVNTLALRTDLSGDPTFLEVLQRVREVALEAYEHQDLPFERLVEDLQSERSLSHNPLFQVMFVLQNAPSSPLKLSGLEVSPKRLVTERAHFDLTLSITERRPGLIARLSYSTDLFEEATIERMVGHFEVLLEGIVKRPEKRISDLPLLKEAERKQLEEWNQTTIEHSLGRDLAALFELQVERTPEAVALEFEGERLTYSELNRRANQLAHWLKKLGVGPEVLVGLYMERSLEMMVAVLGVLKAGGAYVPMDTTYPQDRLAFMLADSNPRVVITQQRLRNRIPEEQSSIICLDSEPDSVSTQSSENPKSENVSESLAYVIYTSGSTGTPKGVAMTRQALVNLISWQCRVSKSKESSRTLQFTSLSFDVSFQEIFSTWCSGGSLVLIQEQVRRDSLALLRFLQEQQIDRLFLPFIALEHMAEAAASCEVLPSTLKEVYTAGEQLIITPKILELFEKLPGCSLHNHYGPSESHVVTAYTLPALKSQWQPRPPIGCPIANCQVYILDDRLRPVPVGVAGELFIGGSCLARGYLDRPELTAERFIPNPFEQDGIGRLYRTGDLGRYLHDGKIEFLGRSDHQVKLRGFRIELGEIESVLARHPKVGQAVVAVRQDVPGDQRLVAYIVGQDEHSCEVGELRSFLSKQLPDYMLPSTYVFLAALPLTPSGKIDRRGLPAVSGADRGSTEGYVGPRDEIERALIEIWEELLGIRPVGVRDNFFELGGHSLLATRLIARIEKRLGGKVSLANLFQSPTIENLAQELQQQEGLRHLSLVPFRIDSSKQLQVPMIQPRQKAGEPALLSFAQQRLWFLDQLLPGSSLYNLPTAVRLSGLLDVQCLEKSINAVVSRHQVLRTTIKSVQGKPFQIVAGDGSLRLGVHDLTMRPEPDKEPEASRVLAEEAQRPFDLAHDLALRATLIKLSEQEHILLLVMHHIASDGWSMGILMRELSHFYDAEVHGKPNSLPELPIQYADYAEWQQGWLQGKVLNKQLDYWKQQLAGVPTRLDLPTDRPRPAVQTFRGASRQLELSPELTQSLKALSLREKASLFMTLLAALQVLLFRYTGQDDIVLGSPIAGRNRGEVEGLIGFFVNTLALRTNLSGDPAFLEVLQRVREVALNAFEHQELPFERLVEELQLERSLSHNPLFQVTFVLQNAPGAPLKLCGLQPSRVALPTGMAKFDLTVSAVERRSGLVFWLSYSTDLFDDATIERMLGHLEVLLGGIVRNPRERISQLPLMKEIEKRRLEEWKGMRTEYPRDCDLPSLFELQVERCGEAVAVIDGKQQLSYRELNSRANQLAHYLRKQGVGSEDRVGVCLERSAAMVLGVLGILKAGGVYVPLDPGYPQERLRFMMEDAGIEVLLIEESLAREMEWCESELGVKAVCLNRDWCLIRGESDKNLVERGTAENLAYIMYTSGSTGQPKGVSIPHRAVSRLVLGTDYVRFGKDEVFLQMAPASFDASTFELWGALLHGARCVLSSGQTPNLSSLGSQIEKHGVTTLWLTSSLFNAVIDDEPEILRTIRQLLIGGEALSVSHVRKANALLPDTQVTNGYGPTENTTFTCCYRIPKEAGSGNSIPIGRSIANTEVYLLDRNMSPVPVGVTGELYTGGDGLARGYWMRAELTAEKFVPNPFGRLGERLYRTGDMARYLADGRIEFIGRADRQVKIRGLRIELGEIESAIKKHPAVQDAVVVAQQDEGGEKRLLAYLVPCTGATENDAEIRESLKGRLPDYMVPASFVLLEKLPLTSNGKIDYRALPADSDLNERSQGSYVAARDDIERELVEIWEDLLERSPIGVRDNFFRFGGHSLLATRLIARIEKRVGKVVSLASLFQSPTIESLAQELREEEGVGLLPLMTSRIEGSKQRQESSIQPRRAAGQPAPLSFAQQRLWFLDQLLPGSSVYNIPVAFRLSGLLEVHCLERSLNALLGRHEVLRTTIERVEGNPFQIVQNGRPLEFVMHDLSLRPDVQREAEASVILAQEAQRPFNLARDLMLRATLIKLTGAEHILLVVVHHIASDGWSMGILMRELSHFYEAETSGRPVSLSELPVQYADYAEWQREWLQGKVLNEQLDYWKQQLAGVPTRLDLPTDRPRPAIQTFQGASRQVELSPELTQGLKALSLREKTSLFMTLLAAFQVLLFRYTGQDDFVLGSPIAGRNRGEVEGLIGFFVNTLALRTDLSGDSTFLEVLQRVKEVALKAYEHQDLPFERLVEELQSERSLSHNPLFQVMFALQNTPGSALKLPGVQVSPTPLVTETAHFDLILSLIERRSTLVGRLSYSTDLFEEATIERMVGHFEVLLEGIVKRPEKRISDLPLLKEAERKQLEEWNQTTIEHSLGRDLAALFELQVERTPEAVALEFEGERLTYSELNRRANQLAHWLKKLGVGPEVLVGLYMERSLEMMVAVLGVLKAGGAYVPMDTTYPQDRLAFMLADSNPRVVITQQRLRNRIPEEQSSIICLDSEPDSVSTQSSENPKSENVSESLAYVIYTSGSTGTPKGVAMTRQALVNLISWQCRVSKSKESSRTLQFTSLSFDVSFQEIFSTWCSGGSLVLIQEQVRRDSLALLRFLQEQQIDRLFLPFIALEHMAEAAASGEVLPSTLKEVYTAGEQLIITPKILELFEKLPGCSLHNHYGPSESHVVTAYTLPALKSQWQPRPPIGCPIANCQVYILDDRLRPVPVGVAGELFIGGSCLARGYLDRPELTAERFIPNPFEQDGIGRLYRTGDLGRYLHDGKIEFLGRSDHQVKLRGFRIELGEIESVLARHPKVGQAVVAVRQDVPGDQRLVAYIVGQDEHSCEVGELRSFLSKQLPDYMLPSTYVFLAALPLTPSGKIDRRGLPAVSGADRGSTEGYVGPRDETERKLTKMWQELLGVERIGIKDNFFDLGGHSLLAIRLIGRVEQELGRTFSLADLFQAPTLESLALNLRKRLSPELPLLVPFRNFGSKPPVFIYGASFELSRYVDTGQPVFGLEPHGQGGRRAPDTIEAMAADYLQQIRAVQSQGPYFIGGYSIGGPVAYEMAQQLRQGGQEVKLLVLIDPTSPSFWKLTSTRPLTSVSPSQGSVLRYRLALQRHWKNLNQLAGKSLLQYVIANLKGKGEYLGSVFKLQVCHIYLKFGLRIPSDLRMFYFFRASADAIRRYRPGPYDGPVVLLSSHRNRVNTRSVWSEFARGGLEIHELPGGHLDPIKGPQVKEWGEQLRSCLLAALSKNPR